MTYTHRARQSLLRRLVSDTATKRAVRDNGVPDYDTLCDRQLWATECGPESASISCHWKVATPAACSTSPSIRHAVSTRRRPAGPQGQDCRGSTRAGRHSIEWRTNCRLTVATNFLRSRNVNKSHRTRKVAKAVAIVPHKKAPVAPLPSPARVSTETTAGIAPNYRSLDERRVHCFPFHPSPVDDYDEILGIPHAVHWHYGGGRDVGNSRDVIAFQNGLANPILAFSHST